VAISSTPMYISLGLAKCFMFKKDYAREG
jgi:hypothetical protein